MPAANWLAESQPFQGTGRVAPVGANKQAGTDLCRTSGGFMSSQDERGKGKEILETRMPPN
jgi:hypothetical protein